MVDGSGGLASVHDSDKEIKLRRENDGVACLTFVSQSECFLCFSMEIVPDKIVLVECRQKMKEEN